MKILIISGFLGSGKTTFIKAMAKATGKDFVIVENEFAEENIDSKLLTQDEAISQMEIFELSEGCICCSLGLDFSYSVMTIANTLNPDFLVVEPSGVAQPTNIIDSLEKIKYERISLLAPVTIVDVNNYLTQNRDYANYFQDQLIAAGTVVLSKSEALSEADFLAAKHKLEVPDDVNFPLRHYSSWEKEEWLRLLEIEYTGEDIAKVGERFTQRSIKREADQDLSNITLQNVEFTNPDQVYHFMEEILCNKYGQVIRAKGFIRAKNELIHVELVEKQFSLTGLAKGEEASLQDEMREAEEKQEKAEFDLNKFILIGKHLQRHALRMATFKANKKLKFKGRRS